jgi:hypothetical protein
MPHRELLGRVVALPILRFGPPGAFLAASPESDGVRTPTILLPGAEIPENAREGDVLDVFVHLDSEDRPVATRHTPAITLNEVAFLSVTDLTPFGAFVDWGLGKELLVPRAEQTRNVRVDERHPIGLYVDPSGRLAGTMRVSEMLQDPGEYTLDAWVEGEAWRKEPGLGIFVILDKRHVGLLPASNPNSLERGERARFRIASVLPDGKIELSTRGLAHEEVDGDAQRILDLLSRPAAPKIGDKSSPEEVQRLVGMSKKAFKRAAGSLLKKRAVKIDDGGYLALAR